MAKPSAKSPRPRPSRALLPAPGEPGLKPASAPVAPVPAASSAPLALPQPGGLWSLCAVLLSFFVPELGLLLGLLYATQEDLRARRFGRWCLALAALGFLVAAITGAVHSALGSGEWMIQPYD